MTDPTQFIVNLSYVHKVMTHEGVVGTGRDLMTGQPCTLHSYSDKFKRSYTMQHYDGVDSDFVSSKLNSMAKTAHSCCVSNTIRLAFMTTRKTSKGNYELGIFYDITGFGDMTLQKLIEMKKQSHQKFEDQQLVSFFWQMADFLFLSIRNNLEFLEITPQNILSKLDGYYGYNFFPTNYGIHSEGTKWQKKYNNPNDAFWKGAKNEQSIVRATMFTFGMVLLEMASLLPSNDLYTNNQINQKLLTKRIQGISLKTDKMISNAIKRLLILDETKRLKIADIYKTDQWMKLRKVVYFPSKADFFEFKNFQGVIQYDKKTSVGEALDKNLSMQRGTFTNGVLEGKGVKEINQNYFMGIFMENNLIEGSAIKKNEYIDTGKFKNNQIIQGVRLYLNIATMNKQNGLNAAFTGDFQNGEPFKGILYCCDGTQKQI